MSEKDAALLRSRLHIKSGKILLDHDKKIHGISTYFDALEYGMRWFVLEKRLVANKKFVLSLSVEELYKLIQNSGRFEIKFDFNHFQMLVEEGLELEKEENLKIEDTITQLITFFEKLEILPFELVIDPLKDGNTRKILGLD